MMLKGEINRRLNLYANPFYPENKQGKRSSEWKKRGEEREEDTVVKLWGKRKYLLDFSKNQ